MFTSLFVLWFRKNLRRKSPREGFTHSPPRVWTGGEGSALAMTKKGAAGEKLPRRPRRS